MRTTSRVLIAAVFVIAGASFGTAPASAAPAAGVQWCPPICPNDVVDSFNDAGNHVANVVKGNVGNVTDAAKDQLGDTTQGVKDHVGDGVQSVKDNLYCDDWAYMTGLCY
jgi:hypothetical protein